jgi:G3E family GTPase
MRLPFCSRTNIKNGCICCTLRADLLREVAKMAQAGKFDLCVIESTGISEPMQVAETFAVTLADLLAQQGLPQEAAQTLPKDDLDLIKQAESLKSLARVDTLVTVIDAASFFDTFDNARALSEEYGDDVDENDQRSIANLMIDQIEFANVIVVNKIDLVSKATLDKVLAVVKKLNPGAFIVESTRSAVPLDLLLNTNMFDMAKVANQAGWLQSLNESIKPETLEYGVGSVVYRQRRPFHPKKFFDLVNALWSVEESGLQIDEHGGDGEEDAEEGEGADEEELAEEEPAELTDEEKAAELAKAEALLERIEQARKALNEARKQSAFAGVLRSKGFVWLTGKKSRNDNICFWSGAGAVLSIGPEGPWFCLRPRETWPDDTAGILADIGDHEHGDRRQEIVFIGIDIDKARLFSALDRCLVTDDEWANAEELEDPMLAWEAGEQK